jgi:S-adenosylmethionine hydrolase
VKTGRADATKTGRKGKQAPDLPIITLLTDFGTADYFVGAVKGAILSINPSVAIVDITHEIPPQNIEAAAFTLLACYATCPPKTIHVVVVDPGVGSTRRPILVRAGGQFFVGPDNGVFTYVYDREPSRRTFHITSDKYFRKPASSTFHGRDIFAPVAAALSRGVKPESFGSEVDDEVRLATSVAPVVRKDGTVEGRIIRIDRFGNCITNITRDLVADETRASLHIKRKVFGKFRNFYGDSPADELFAIWGSAGFLEISLNLQSAAKVLKLNQGDRVTLKAR